MPIQQPGVLIVVLSHNKREQVLQCLASLERHAGPECHIVVVDNASDDGTVDAIRARFASVDLICNTDNEGPARGRNKGVAHGATRYSFDFILFLDDDAEVRADAIGELVRAFSDYPGAGIACGKTFIAPESDILMGTGIVDRLWLGYCFDRGAGEPDLGQYNDSSIVDACGSFAMMVRREVFDQLGGFDPVFTPYGWEDVDLCLRARATGYATAYTSRASFIHKGTRMGRGPVPAYERHKIRNLFVLLSRHLSPVQKLAALFTVPLRGLQLFARFALQGRVDVILAQLNGLSDFAFRRRRR